jgi:hypothetical protein
MDQSLREAWHVLQPWAELSLPEMSAADLKRLFRRAALATHPDLAAEAVDREADRFLQAMRAYELLWAHLQTRPAREAAPRADARPAAAPGPGARPARPPAGPAAGPASRPAAASAAPPREGPFYHRGPIPARRLRTAEFLFYSGVISWQTMIDAVVWQRRQRPRFGELAQQFRAATRDEIAWVLGEKGSREPTGVTAVRLSVLSDDEVGRILRYQRAIQAPIGRFFLERNHLSRPELVELVRELFRHNLRAAQVRPRA